MILVGSLVLGLQLSQAQSKSVLDNAPDRVMVTGCWVDLESLKPGTNSDVIQCPTIIVSLKDGDQHPNATIGQGNLRDDPKRDDSWQSSASLSVAGKTYPFKLLVEYEFRNNAGRHFRIKQELEVLNKRDRAVLRSTDGDRLLLLSWEPRPVEKKTINEGV